MKNKKRKYVLERRIKIGIIKSFRWGWFKFAKCLFGTFIFSLAINLFIVPNHLYTGGILGLAQIIRTAIISIFNIDYGFDLS